MPQLSTLSRSARFSPSGSAKPKQVWLCPRSLRRFTSHFTPPVSAWLHNPNLSLWLSVDPLSDKYPGVSPYAYCAGNPVGLVDVDGREVWITGGFEARHEFFKKIKQEAKTLGVAVKMNRHGLLSAKYVGKSEISTEAQLVINAIQDQSVVVNILASYSDYAETSNGKTPMFAGTYMGNMVILNRAFCLQQVNPIDIKTMDKYYAGKTGLSGLHEVTESYIGGTLALQRGRGDVRTGKDNHFFESAHGTAIKQSGTPTVYYFDRNGNQSKYSHLPIISVGWYGERNNVATKFKEVDF